MPVWTLFNVAMISTRRGGSPGSSHRSSRVSIPSGLIARLAICLLGDDRREGDAEASDCPVRL